jgi:hypothetical protein
LNTILEIDEVVLWLLTAQLHKNKLEYTVESGKTKNDVPEAFLQFAVRLVRINDAAYSGKDVNDIEMDGSSRTNDRHWRELC